MVEEKRELAKLIGRLAKAVTVEFNSRYEAQEGLINALKNGTATRSQLWAFKDTLTKSLTAYGFAQRGVDNVSEAIKLFNLLDGAVDEAFNYIDDENIEKKRRLGSKSAGVLERYFPKLLYMGEIQSQLSEEVREKEEAVANPKLLENQRHLAQLRRNEKGYWYNKPGMTDLARELYGEKPSNIKEKDEGGLEKLTSIIAISSLALSLFFLSSNLTGNVIGLNQTASNWIGAALFVLGLVGVFFYFRNRK